MMAPVAAALQRRADHFTPFLFSMSDEIVSIEQFCRKHVEAMGEESDHIHIVAITDALQAPIR
jgi:ubiquitin thioesterase protein OTUB1